MNCNIDIKITNQLVALFLLCVGIVNSGRVQQILPTTYVTAGEPAVLSCTPPASNQVLTWKVDLNATDLPSFDVAQNFLGGIDIFQQFDLPPGRTTLTLATLNITSVRVEDEGYYWCELKSATSQSLLSDKYPLHVYYKPKDPTVRQIGRDVVQEDTITTVAECGSKGGKPGAKLTWWNGTQQLDYLPEMVVINDTEDLVNRLQDTSLMLTVQNWTRFDHRRNFTCLIEHPSYKGASKRLNYSVNVLYHPVNARIWANLTTLTVYCEADGYKPPIYSWVLPGGIEEYNTSLVVMSNLYQLDKNDYFECTADNNVPPAAVVRVLVEDLRYPNGRPPIKFAGLDLYVWIAIAGGVLLLIVVLIAACCCHRRRKKKKKKNANYAAKYTRPTVKESATRHSQPSLLDFNDMRTPDGRDSTLPTKDTAYRKPDMERSYSLENLAARKFGNDPRSSVTLMPLQGQGARDNLYNDTSLNRRASREEIDKVADHIEVLNKSWDNLARSRENLNRSREELHVDRPPPPRYDDIPEPQGRFDERDNYPYMDDTVDGRRQEGPTRSYSNRNYYEHEIIPQGPFHDQSDRYRDNNRPYDDRFRGNDDHYQDDRRDNYPRGNQPDRHYDDRRDNYHHGNQPYDDGYRDNRRYDDGYHGDRAPLNPRDDDRYQDSRPYNDGYNASGGGNRNSRDFEAQRYDDRRYHDDRRPPVQSDYSHNQRQASFADSEFDDDQGGYDSQQGGYGYQPASMI